MIKLYTDGGARPNPGEGGIGFVAYRGKKKLLDGYMYFPKLTNNQAEFIAAINALSYIYGEYGIKEEVVLHTDSLLLRDSTFDPSDKKFRRINSQNLRGIHDVLIDTIKIFENITVKWIPRQLNHEADGLVKQAIILKKAKVVKYED